MYVSIDWLIVNNLAQYAFTHLCIYVCMHSSTYNVHVLYVWVVSKSPSLNKSPSANKCLSPTSMVMGEYSKIHSFNNLVQYASICHNWETFAAQGTYVLMYVWTVAHTVCMYCMCEMYIEIWKKRKISVSKSPSFKPSPLHSTHVHSHVLPTPLTRELDPVLSHE